MTDGVYRQAKAVCNMTSPYSFNELMIYYMVHTSFDGSHFWRITKWRLEGDIKSTTNKTNTRELRICFFFYVNIITLNRQSFRFMDCLCIVCSRGSNLCKVQSLNKFIEKTEQGCLFHICIINASQPWHFLSNIVLPFQMGAKHWPISDHKQVVIVQSSK